MPTLAVTRLLTTFIYETATKVASQPNYSSHMSSSLQMIKIYDCQKIQRLWHKRSRLSFHYLIKERALPFNCRHQIIVRTFLKGWNFFIDSFWESQIEVITLMWIESIPNFFSLPFTNSIDRRYNIRVIEDLSIKFFTVRFVP